MNKKTKVELVMPFSEKFLPYWQTWKNFKKEEWGFEYRGVTSEQMAIMHLVSLSEGIEERAVKILCQSVRRRWQGFWPLHETTSPHGKSTSTQKGQSNGDSLEDRVKNEFIKRNGEWQQGTNGSNLKAV